MSINDEQISAEGKKVSPKSIWIAAIIVAVALTLIFYYSYRPDDLIEKETSARIDDSDNNYLDYFSDCPVSVGGHVDQSRNGTTVTLYFHNNSDYTIGAIKFLAVSYNVYGEKMNFGERKYIYQKYSIDAGGSRTVTLSLIKGTKSIKIYVYNVYYKNDEYAEWGIRNYTDKVVTLAPCFEVVDYN